MSDEGIFKTSKSLLAVLTFLINEFALCTFANPCTLKH